MPPALAVEEQPKHHHQQQDQAAEGQDDQEPPLLVEWCLQLGYRRQMREKKNRIITKDLRCDDAIVCDACYMLCFSPKST